MGAVFDPLSLTEEASLNSLELADLPGAEAAWVGHPVFELLSLHALQQLAAEAGDRRTGPPDEAVVVGWLADHPMARGAVETFGRRLGHLIATLTVEPGRGPSVHGWRRAFLDHWLGLERVWLAGGIVAGLASDLLPAVRSEAKRLGSRVQIEVAPHAGVLALLGAARSWPGAWRCAAVLDCGHTAVKRAVALADEHGLRRLVVLPACATDDLGDSPTPGMLATFVGDRVVETLQAAGAHGRVDSLVRLSLASYVRQGQPISSRSIYGRLPVQALVAELRARAGPQFDIRLGHDGTLAAAGLPTPGHAAVIVVGTYLGSGFPPPTESLLPLAPDFCTQGA